MGDHHEFFENVGILAVVIVSVILAGLLFLWISDFVDQVRKYHRGEIDREEAERLRAENHELKVQIEALKNDRL